MMEELLAPLLLTERGRKTGFALILILGCVLFLSVINVLKTWYDDFHLAKNPVANVISVNDEMDKQTQLIAEIPSTHIFGLATEADDFLPITSLQLRLTGIIKNTETTQSKVIVSEAGRPGVVYGMGDTLTSGIKINAINVDGIVLEHEGRLEKLPLVRTPLQFQETPTSLWQSN
jgi:type II secretory pathway component PulC